MTPDVWHDIVAVLDRLHEGKVTPNPDPGFRDGWNEAMRWVRDEVAYERSLAHRHAPQFAFPRQEQEAS